MNTNKTDQRIHSFDFMRILAVCGVIMIHISADFVKDSPVGSMNFLYGNLFNSLSRFAVPIFLMISGSLMLNQDKDLSTNKILKSALNIFSLLVAWSLIYSIGYNIVKPIVFKDPISLSDFFDTLFNGHYHLWYLFALVGLYALSPILRFFIKRENATLIRNYLIFMVIVCFVVSFTNEIVNIYTSTENIVSDYVSNFELNYIFEYLIYFILGWYLNNIELSKKARIAIYIGGIIGLVSTFVCAQIFFVPGADDTYFYSNDSLNVFLYSVAVFVFIHSFFKNRNLTASRFVQQLSKLTFGVYLIHCIFLFGFKLLFKNIAFAPLAMCAIFVTTVLASFATVKIMSKIPVIKKLIRG